MKHVNRNPNEHMDPSVTHRCPVCGTPFWAAGTCSGDVDYSQRSDGCVIPWDSTHDPVPVCPIKLWTPPP